MPKFSECWRCGKNATGIVCPLCQVAKYCSDKCQTGDRARHNVNCEAAKAMKKCGACGKIAPSLKTCSACFQAFYCDTNCQIKDRSRHKRHCMDVVRTIKSLAQTLATTYPLLGEGIPKLYYWGNSPAFDCLNVGENEGYDYKNPFNVLFCGVGDIRNVALTCASIPDHYETKLNFTLNDLEPCTLARLVLLLYMLIKGESGIEEKVTDVWYSTKLSEQTYLSLTTFLRELVEMASSDKDLKANTKGLVLMRDDHLNELKTVWKTWLDLPVMKTTWIQKQRQQAIESDPGNERGRRAYFYSIPSEHVNSAKKWLKSGLFCESKIPLIAENPTLTGCPLKLKGCPFSFISPPDILPFTGWDYLQLKKFTHRDSLVDMYRIYIEDVLKRFKRKLDPDFIQFKIVLGNFMEIDQFLEPKVKYDRILTSNLADYIPLPHLLKSCSEKLNHCNPYATIVTEIQNWSRHCPGADVFGMSPFCVRKLDLVAKEDTNNPTLVMKGGGISIREYINNSNHFLEYLRASFYAFSSPEHPKLPSPKTLGNDFQLELRNYLRNENRLVFFKLAVNCRRPTMVSGVERALEWKTMKKKRIQRDQISLNV